jgi:hypothetical protein
MPTTQENRTGISEQSINTNVDASLSLLITANNPQLIAPPPPGKFYSQTPTYTMPLTSSSIDKQRKSGQDSTGNFLTRLGSKREFNLSTNVYPYQ